MTARGGDGDQSAPSTGRHEAARLNPGVTEGAARILVVEDQEDVRRMLATALLMEGHVVNEAATAADGLKCLEQSRYDLVLSDYAMPGGTGAWMLHQASQLGLMKHTIALIVTAHPDVRDLENVEIVTKPLDLDKFLEQVRHILSKDAHAEDVREASSNRSGTNVRSDRHRVDLVLYVSSASPACIQARRNLEQLLEQFDVSQVRFSICDLGREPTAGDADRIAFTPTLVKRYPEPKMWVLGNLREPQIIADLLRACGVDARE